MRVSGPAAEEQPGRRRARRGRTPGLAAGGVTASGAGASGAGASGAGASKMGAGAVALGAALVSVVVALLLLAFPVRVHVVASDAMDSTLAIDQRVVSSTWAVGPEGPERGDVVVLAHGSTWEDAELPAASGGGQLWTITRVIGRPGDAVACCDAEGRITIDGEPRVEPVTVADAPFTPGALDCASWPRSERCFPAVTVPAGRLLVLGDHRGAAPDSMVLCRGTAPASGCARFVPAERVAGRVVAKLWPPGPVG